MFKIILYISLLFWSFISNAQVDPSKNSEAVHADHHLRDCFGGTGSCLKANMFDTSKAPNAILSKVDDTKIVLIIDKKEFSDEELLELRETRTFNVSGEGSLSLDRNLLAKLGVEPSLSELLAGNYPVEIKDNVVEITFTLVKR